MTKLKKIRDQSVLMGENLIPRSVWVPPEQMIGDYEILKHPIFEKAFNKILELHRPKSNVAFLSLCTKQRPYNIGRKWKKFIEYFGECSDLIVCSNGGVIPQQFWNEYPYLQYDGAAEGKNITLYANVMSDRLRRFFTTHNYEGVIANFSPKNRNHQIANELLSDLRAQQIIKDFAVIPNKELYNKVRDDNFSKCGRRYPDLHKFTIAELQRTLRRMTLFSSLTSGTTSQSAHSDNSMGDKMAKNDVGKKIEEATAKREAEKIAEADAEEVRIATLKDEYSDTLAEIKSAISEAYQSGNKSLIDYISLGTILFKSYKTLKNDFYKVITDEIINSRMSLRYIKLVVSEDTKQNIKTKMTDEDFDSLKEDKRVTSLTLEEIKDLRDPSMKKLMEMKRQKLKPTQWKKILKGDDKSYIEAKSAPKDKETTKLKKENLEAYKVRLNAAIGDPQIANKIVKAKQEYLLETLCTAYENIKEKDTEITKLKLQLGISDTVPKSQKKNKAA